MKALYLFFCLIISTSSLATNEDNNYDVLTGHAYDFKTNILVYKEIHNYSFVDGEKVMRSQFSDPEGNAIAERVIEYRNDKVSSYQLVQNNIKYEESIKIDNRNLQFEKRDESNVSKNRIETYNDIVIDAGFSDYIVMNWDALGKGETLKFDFASVSQMGKVRLQVKAADTNTTSAKEHMAAAELIMFKMTIANPVLKMFIKPIEVGYYKESRQLAYYKGISNIKNANGKQYSLVRIEYHKNVNAL